MDDTASPLDPPAGDTGFLDPGFIRLRPSSADFAATSTTLSPDALGAPSEASVQAFEQRVRRDLPQWIGAFITDVAQGLAQAALRAHGAPDPRLAAELQAVLQHRHRAMTQSMVLAVNEQMDEAGREALARVSGVRQSTTAAPLLSLIAEDQIDEDIALAGIVQSVESECDGELRQLTGLCNGLSGRAVFAIEANPIGPGLCAKALRESLTPLGLSAPARVLMLHLASQTLGRRLLGVYAGYIELLRSWRVKPSDVQLRTAAAVSTSVAADAAPGHAAAPTSAREIAALAGQGIRIVGPQAAGASTAPTEGPAPAAASPSTSPTKPPDKPSAKSSTTSGAGPLSSHSGAFAKAEPKSSLERLVAHAHRLFDAASAPAPRAPEAEAGLLELRLFDEPRERTEAPAPPPPPLAADVAVRVMLQILEQLARQSSLSAGTRDLLQRLQAPARDLAGRDTTLWADADHPWWRLLDRMVVIGEVHDATETTRPGRLNASLARVVEGLGQRGGSIDRRACQRAADEADHVAACLHEERQAQAQQHSDLGGMQTEADREALALEMRRQIVAQLRASPASAGMRQFLVGTWASAMTHVAVSQGSKSAVFDHMAQCVDDLLHAGSKPGQPLPAAHQSALLRAVQYGLLHGALPDQRAKSELAVLADLLRDPPPLVEEAPPAHQGALDALDTRPAREAIGDPMSAFSYAALPTVPIDMTHLSDLAPAPDGTNAAAPRSAPSRAALDRAAWIDSLQPGDYCRMFLMGSWMTTQLSWLSGNRTLFVFSSRHRDGSHSLTRHALEKLRNAGLATTVTQGLLLARAMDSMLDSDLR